MCLLKAVAWLITVEQFAQMWLLVFRNGQTSFCTDFGDAFWLICKCKCDENMFWCQNTHKTYSIVLMYICFCGATYTIMTRQFTMYGYALLLLELQTCFLSIQNVFFFPKWKPIVMNVQHLKLWVSSYHLLSTSWLNKPVFFYVWGLESLSSPCTVFAHMPFKHIHLSSDLFTLALIEAVWFAYRWQLKGIRDQKMEHGAKNVFTQYCKCLWAHLFLCCAKWCSSMCLCFYPYTVFIISQVGIAILICSWRDIM